MNATKKEEFTRVQRVSDGKYNLINKQGKLLLKEWFKSVGCFYNGFSVVQRGYNQYNFIDKQVKLLSDEWFKSVDYFNKDGLARVKRTSGEQAKIDKNGKIVSE